MAAETVEKELATHLVARLTALNADASSRFFGQLGAWTVGGNVRVGPVLPPSENQSVARAVPHKCIFLMGYGGRKPIHYKGAAGGERYPAVQAWIRSDLNKYEAGKLVADAVVEAFDAQVPTSVLDFYDLRVLNSEPFFIQQDDAGHAEWTVNVEAARRL